MVFGEIVEPSTRALLDDDDYPEYTPPTIEWTGDQQCLSRAESLIFVETRRIGEIFHKFILQDLKPVCSTKNNIYIYEKSNHFIIVHNESYYGANDLATGEVIKSIENYIVKAKQIITITSRALSAYEGELDREAVECLFKCLSTNKLTFDCDRLKSPNFITGLGGDVLSYCIYKKLQCSSFVLYHKNFDVDTLSSKPVLELAEKLGLSPSQHYLKTELPKNNLYM
ncbi:uncharacterized protein LOC123315125 [Coccinella septempunctata]|uniref:uncharacterized protein LOC123315125 n=1 Tax=Coccinella septempunctata TaxID=41139 RepID=UPI001D095C2E|nr:uncharacterized protein LOC123315125 [Coccinella septempunctata]